METLLEFKKQLILFFDELIDQFPDEGDLVMFRLFIANQIPIEDVMKIFIHKVNANNKQLKKMVKDRNEQFFLDHNVFDTSRTEKVTHFRKLWLSGQLDKNDKEIIWTWIDTFIYLSDKYLSQTV